MADKVKDLENRLNRLEDRLKATFLEVEKKFENLHADEPPIIVMEQRVQEVEDLLLLLQIEVSKLKETIGSGFEFKPTISSSTSNVPGVNTRLKKMEDDIESLRVEPPAAKHTPYSEEPFKEKIKEVNIKLKEIEANIASLDEKASTKAQGMPANTEKITSQLDEIEERLERLEKEKELTPISVGVLEDVRRILHS